MNPAKLAEIIRQEVAKGNERFYERLWQRGVVTVVNGQKCSVLIEGGTVAMPNIICLDGYDPVVGDKVLIASVGDTGANFVIMGAINGTALQWVTPAFLNGWTNYGSGWETIGYMKDQDGRVHLRGLLTIGSASPIFQLPEGYRPSSNSHIPAATSSGYGVINVFSDGVVSRNLGPGAGGWMSLAAISFPTR